PAAAGSRRASSATTPSAAPPWRRGPSPARRRSAPPRRGAGPDGRDATAVSTPESGGRPGARARRAPSTAELREHGGFETPAPILVVTEHVIAGECRR